MSQENRLELMHETLLAIANNDNNKLQKSGKAEQKSRFWSQRIRQNIPEVIAGKFATVTADNHGGNNYSLTKKGIAYLDNYDVIMNFVTSFGIL